MASRAVAYYRVSTRQQGKSGLGLDAQKAAIQELVQREGLELVGEFTEVETGTGKRLRPQSSLLSNLAEGRTPYCSLLSSTAWRETFTSLQG